MKRYFQLFLLLGLTTSFQLNAQTIAQGFQYQAVLRNAFNQPLSNLPVALKITLAGDNRGLTINYTEEQHITTNEQGLFNIVIGEGNPISGVFAEVPWSKEQIWLKVEMMGNNKRPVNLISNNRLLAVPYALYARTASALAPTDEEPIEKNQSIYWTTSGNSGTVPPVHFMGSRDARDVIIKTHDTTRVILTKEGQMRIKSYRPDYPLSSPAFDTKDQDINNYPLIVEGSNQGIYIKVNGSRSNANNFLTFADDYGIWGTVEGQTTAELEDTWQYKLQIDAYIIESVSIAAQGISAIGKGIALVYSSLASVAGVASLAAGVKFALDVSTIAIFKDTYFTEIHNQIGVTYTTGRADYAEWLEREYGDPDLHFGDIVGVRGGKISLNTAKADHYRVVSKNPGVLGNQPKAELQPNFEKIAFMGQVLVKVTGPVAVGDYIIPSGNHDGYGIAVHPEKMKIGDYIRIVGVAWEAADDAPLNYVNVAVGISSNDLSRQVEQLDQKISAIENHLKGQSSLLNSETLVSPRTTLHKQIADEDFDKMLDQHQAIYKAMYAKAKINLQQKGIDIHAYPQLAEFFDNPIEVIKKMRRDPKLFTQWALADKKMMQTK